MLLERVGLPFTADPPAIDESPLPGERPRELVSRLAVNKARAVAGRHPGAFVIGSDQVAALDGRALGKPGGHAANVEQLLAVSGRRVEFLTALCVLNGSSGGERLEVVPFAVVFRRLNRTQVEGYVRRERAYDCAGGFRVEGSGLLLCERLEGEDPSALVGLPLIRLARMLEAEGLDPLVLAPAGA